MEAGFQASGLAAVPEAPTSAQKNGPPVRSKNADSQTHAVSIADFGDRDLWRKPCNEAGSAIDNDVLLTRAMNSAVHYRRNFSDALPHCVAHELADRDISHEELIFVVGQAFQSDYRIVSAAQVDLEAIREHHRFRPCDRRVIGHTRSVLDFFRHSRRRSTPPEKRRQRLPGRSAVQQSSAVDVIDPVEGRNIAEETHAALSGAHPTEHFA